MKKTLSLLAVIFVLIFAVSCENSKKDDKETIDTDTTDTENPDGNNADSSDTEPTEQTDTDTEKPDTGDSAHDDDADTSDTGKPDSDNDDADSENDDDADTSAIGNDDDADSENNDDADSENDDDTDTDSEEDQEPLEIIGRYVDDWGTSHVITETDWTMKSSYGVSIYKISQYSNKNDFIIAQNDESNDYAPEKWSRFDYTEKNGELYYCTTAYDAATEEAALATPAADKTDPATSGCGSSPWTKLSPALEIAGKYIDNYKSSHVISSFEWINESLVYNISQYDNEQGFIIAQNDNGNEWNPKKWSRFDYTEKDGVLYYCQTAYDAETEEAALATPAPDKTDPATSGCGSSPWTELKAPLEIAGKYIDNYSENHVISSTEWLLSAVWGNSLYHISQYDNEQGFIIAQNDAKNTYNPNNWSRFDYTEKDGVLYYCTTAYDAETEEAALATPAADKTDPATSGCGSSPWTKMFDEPLEIAGKWYDYKDSSEYNTFSSKGWSKLNTFYEAMSGLMGDNSGYEVFYNIVKYDNENGTFIAYKEDTKYSKVNWILTEKDGEEVLYYCEIAYNKKTIEVAEAAADADKTDPEAEKSCGNSHWSALAFAGSDNDMFAEREEAANADDDYIDVWASGYNAFNPGEGADAEHNDPSAVEDEADGEFLSLGRGGSILVTFTDPILLDGGDYGEVGSDFIVFASETNQGLAKVEVSSDGETFVAFDNVFLGLEGATLDETKLFGFAGRFGEGKGTKFDLYDLVLKPEVTVGTVDLENITYVRITDIPGDGSVADSHGNPIFYPYPAGGFELDAVAAVE